MPGRPRAIVAEEATFLISCGESAEQVLKALGMSAGAVAKACRLNAEAEVAVVFEQLSKKKWKEYV
jgi:hypothetical protein